MSNPNQKIYTLALGKCTGEFTIAYDFSGDSLSRLSGGSVNISEITDKGSVNNLFLNNNGSRSKLIKSKSTVVVKFTNYFSYPISVDVDFCENKINQVIQPNQTRIFSRKPGSCEYSISWSPVDQKISKQSTAVAGSIAVTWDNVNLNSGDTSGVGSLVLIKDKETPTTGQLIITQPPGAIWSVYLDCPDCVIIEDSDSDSDSDSESDSESESSESESSESESDSESGSESDSESSECCQVAPPSDSGALLNPGEYMTYWRDCMGGDLDIEMAPVCPNPQRNIRNQNINIAQSGVCCGSAIEGGWVCTGYETESECNAANSPSGETNWIAGGDCQSCDSLGNGNGGGNNPECSQECTGGDPYGSRVHLADITPSMAEQYWTDLKNSCQGTSYGPFPIIVDASCASSVIGQQPSGLDVGGNDVQEYLSRTGRTYCPVDQEIKAGPLYMIGSDGNCGCAPVPMKYVVCNGCYVGFGANSCGKDDYESDCPDSDSDSESDLPGTTPPPPPLPPEQDIAGLGAAINFVPFNPPVPPVGQAGQGGPPGLNAGVPRDIDVRVGRVNPNRIGTLQDENNDCLCNEAKVLFTFTGNVPECTCLLDEVKIKCKINGVIRAEKVINNPGVGEVIDYTFTAGPGGDLPCITMADNGNYNFEWTVKQACKEISGETANANLIVNEQQLFTEYKTCDTAPVKVEVYCDGTLAQQIPAEVNGKEVCKKCQCFVAIPGADLADYLSSQQYQDECGNSTTLTLFKREHKAVGGGNVRSMSSYYEPTGCATNSLIYQVITDEFYKNDVNLTLTMPNARGVMHAFTSGGTQSLVLSEEPDLFETPSVSDLEQTGGCTDYTSATTTAAPSEPGEEVIVEIGPDKRSTREYIVGTPGTISLTLQAGTMFMLDNGEPATCNFKFSVKPSGGIIARNGNGNQWGYVDGGGWYSDQPGRIFQVATWDHGGIGDQPIGIARGISAANANNCEEAHVVSWDLPAQLSIPIPPEVVPDFNNALAAISVFRLDRNLENEAGQLGTWITKGPVSIVNNEIRAEINEASTWNVDVSTPDVCGVLLVYPPSQLLDSREVTDMGPVAYSADHRQFKVSPGIGFRWRPVNSNVLSNWQTVDFSCGDGVCDFYDTITDRWPQVMQGFPKTENGKVLQWEFEFYDNVDTNNKEFSIMSGGPAPPGDPNAPAICNVIYENPEPGFTPVCVLDTCGMSPCKRRRIQKKYKSPGDGLGGSGTPGGRTL